MTKKIIPQNTQGDLPDTTPLFFEWITRELEKLEHDQHPIPNTPKLPYHKRLERWADHEPQRKIMLYYTSANFTDKQKQMMMELKTRPNIEVIDFDEKFKDKFDLRFLENDKVQFSWKVDLMRIIMLLEDGPGIYFDFDILLKKGYSKIGSISIPNKEGILMANDEKMGLQNSIVAVNSPRNQVLRCIYDAVIKAMEDPIKFEKLVKIPGCLVFHLQKFSIRYISDENYSIDDLPAALEQGIDECLSQNLFSDVFFPFRESNLILERFTVQNPGIHITRDRSWQKEPADLHRSGEQRDKENIDTNLENTRKPENLTKNKGRNET